MGVWVDAGLIEPDQADRIVDFEAAQESRPDTGGRSSQVAEIAGYVGAALAVIAAGILLGEVWDRLRPWAQLLLLGTVSGSLFLAGLVLRDREEATVRRLVDVLWLGAVAGTAFTLGVAGDRGLDAREEQIALVVSSGTTVVALGLYLLRRHTLQQVPVLLGLLATAVSAVLLPRAETAPLYVGLLLWGIGVAWLLLTAGRIVVPVDTGLVLASLAMGVGGQTASVDAHAGIGLVGSLLTCGALLLLSVVGRTTLLAGAGLIGLFVFIPQAVFHFLGDSLGAPLALLLTGLLLVGGAVGTLTLRREVIGGDP